jgi:serine/threonine protein kinase
MSTGLYELPGYEVGDEIARTDRAIVFEGRDESRDRPVALKLVQNDESGWHEVEMLRLVAKANPEGPVHVMRLLDICEDSHDLWLVLDYFQATLSDLDPQAMTPLALMNIALDTAKGLVEMVRADVIDDDVKPANVAFKAASGRVAHVDLGCARLSGEKPVGSTAGFNAPEIEHGIPSDTSPCYGWGRTVEWLVTGKTGQGPEFLLDRFVPWIGPTFARVVATCVQHDPNDRPEIDALYEYVKEIVHRRRRCCQCNAVRFDDAACPTCGRE